MKRFAFALMLLALCLSCSKKGKVTQTVSDENDSALSVCDKNEKTGWYSYRGYIELTKSNDSLFYEWSWGDEGDYISYLKKAEGDKYDSYSFVDGSPDNLWIRFKFVGGKRCMLYQNSEIIDYFFFDEEYRGYTNEDHNQIQNFYQGIYKTSNNHTITISPQGYFSIDSKKYKIKYNGSDRYGNLPLFVLENGKMYLMENTDKGGEYTLAEVNHERMEFYEKDSNVILLDKKGEQLQGKKFTKSNVVKMKWISTLLGSSDRWFFISDLVYPDFFNENISLADWESLNQYLNTKQQLNESEKITKSKMQELYESLREYPEKEMEEYNKKHHANDSIR